MRVKIEDMRPWKMLVSSCTDILEQETMAAWNCKAFTWGCTGWEPPPRSECEQDLHGELKGSPAAFQGWNGYGEAGFKLENWKDISPSPHSLTHPPPDSCLGTRSYFCSCGRDGNKNHHHSLSTP